VDLRYYHWFGFIAVVLFIENLTVVKNATKQVNIDLWDKTSRVMN
jgi:hypothetical protein